MMISKAQTIQIFAIVCCVTPVTAHKPTPFSKESLLEELNKDLGKHGHGWQAKASDSGDPNDAIVYYKPNPTAADPQAVEEQTFSPIFRHPDPNKPASKDPFREGEYIWYMCSKTYWQLGRFQAVESVDGKEKWYTVLKQKTKKKKKTKPFLRHYLRHYGELGDSPTYNVNGKRLAKPETRPSWCPTRCSYTEVNKLLGSATKEQRAVILGRAPFLDLPNTEKPASMTENQSDPKGDENKFGIEKIILVIILPLIGACTFFGVLYAICRAYHSKQIHEPRNRHDVESPRPRVQVADGKVQKKRGYKSGNQAFVHPLKRFKQKLAKGKRYKKEQRQRRGRS